MATKKTAIFTLTERLTLAAAATPTATATIDIGSYVDVGDRQALQIHSVDFIHQGATASDALNASVPGNSAVLTQLTDLNRGGLVFANDRALIGSSALRIDCAGAYSYESDLYSDHFGNGADAGRYVWNNQRYVTTRCTGKTGATANIRVRIMESIGKLYNKDLMAIAIQSTAEDNGGENLG